MGALLALEKHGPGLGCCQGVPSTTGDFEHPIGPGSIQLSALQNRARFIQYQYNNRAGQHHEQLPLGLWRQMAMRPDIAAWLDGIEETLDRVGQLGMQVEIGTTTGRGLRLVAQVAQDFGIDNFHHGFRARLASGTSAVTTMSPAAASCTMR